MYFNNIADFLNQADSIECTTIPVLKGELKDMNLSALFQQMRDASEMKGAEAMNCSKVALAQNAYIENYNLHVEELEESRQTALEGGWDYYQYGHYCCLLEYNDAGTDYNIGFNMEMRVLMDVENDEPVAINVYFHRDHSTRQINGKMVTKLVDTTYNYQEKSRLGLLASAAEITEHFLRQTIACAEKSRFHHKLASKQVYEHYCF